jgi:hypothetical protein
MADTPAPAAPSVTKQLKDITAEIEDTPRPDRDAPIEDQRQFRQRMNELSKKAALLRRKQIAEDPKLSDDEKKVLAMYDQGKHLYEIAKTIYKFANRDTVGEVLAIVQKAHKPDYDKDVDTIKSTRGYTGIGVSA